MLPTPNVNAINRLRLEAEPPANQIVQQTAGLFGNNNMTWWCTAHTAAAQRVRAVAQFYTCNITY
jgi:hypothetical protein